MEVGPYQLVVCQGPRCRSRGRPAELLGRLAQRRHGSAALSQQVFAGTYECLGRCPAGPNVVVRRLPAGSVPDGSPGMLELDGAIHYWACSLDLLERIIDEHCLGGCPIAGRHQPY